MGGRARQHDRSTVLTEYRATAGRLAIPAAELPFALLEVVIHSYDIAWPVSRTVRAWPISRRWTGYTHSLRLPPFPPPTTSVLQPSWSTWSAPTSRDQPPRLTLGALYPRLCHRLLAKNLPVPRQRCRHLVPVHRQRRTDAAGRGSTA
jgi:hypothetical protein